MKNQSDNSIKSKHERNWAQYNEAVQALNTDPSILDQEMLAACECDVNSDERNLELATKVLVLLSIHKNTPPTRDPDTRILVEEAVKSLQNYYATNKPTNEKGEENVFLMEARIKAWITDDTSQKYRSESFEKISNGALKQLEEAKQYYKNVTGHQQIKTLITNYIESAAPSANKNNIALLSSLNNIEQYIPHATATEMKQLTTTLERIYQAVTQPSSSPASPKETISTHINEITAQLEKVQKSDRAEVRKLSTIAIVTMAVTIALTVPVAMFTGGLALIALPMPVMIAANAASQAYKTGKEINKKAEMLNQLQESATQFLQSPAPTSANPVTPTTTSTKAVASRAINHLNPTENSTSTPQAQPAVPVNTAVSNAPFNIKQDHQSVSGRVRLPENERDFDAKFKKNAINTSADFLNIKTEKSIDGGYILKSYDKNNQEQPKLGLNISKEGAVSAHSMNLANDEKKLLAEKMVAAFLTAGNKAPSLINIKCSDDSMKKLMTGMLEEHGFKIREPAPLSQVSGANSMPTAKEEESQEADLAKQASL